MKEGKRGKEKERNNELINWESAWSSGLTCRNLSTYVERRVCGSNPALGKKNSGKKNLASNCDNCLAREWQGQAIDFGINHGQGYIQYNI